MVSVRNFWCRKPSCGEIDTSAAGEQDGLPHPDQLRNVSPTPLNPATSKSLERM